MGKLQTVVTLPKRILLQGWANDEGGLNINGEYTYTINFDITIIQGGFISAFYNGYKHNTLNSFIYFLGGWEFLTTADPNQWDNPSTNNVLPLTGWIENNAQGPAGTITILENISGKNNKISIKKQNINSGKLSLSNFDPKNISNIALWTKQGSLTNTIDYVPIRLSFGDGSGGQVIYNGGDIDVNYYLLDPASAYYEGEQFGFYIFYDESVGLWYLYDPNLDSDTASAENLYGPWTAYGDLVNFYLEDLDVDTYSEYNPTQYTWSDISGKNNHLVTRKNPGIYQGVISSTIKGLETKLVRTPFKTTNTINFFLPFTIYIVLLDGYAGVATRTILGAGYVLYLESTSFSGAYHTFALKYNTIFGLQTICSFNVLKLGFASLNIGPSILKISNNYLTTSASPIRNVTLSYYNSNSSLSANGTASFNQNSSAGNLYLGNKTFGSPILGDFYLSEVLIYNKSVSTEEDGSINRYLQRKYYGKLLS